MQLYFMQSFFFVKFSHFLSFFGSRNPQKSRLHCLPAHRYAGKQEASGSLAQAPEVRSLWSLLFKNAALAVPHSSPHLLVSFGRFAFAFVCSFRSVVSPSFARFVQSFRFRLFVSFSRLTALHSLTNSAQLLHSLTNSAQLLHSLTNSARLNSLTHSQVR